METPEKNYLIDHGFDVKAPFDAEAVEIIMKEYANEYHQHKLKSMVSSSDVMRYFLVSFDGEGSGSVWFSLPKYPSNRWVKEQITSKFPEVKTPAIRSIQELNEEDYKCFCA